MTDSTLTVDCTYSDGLTVDRWLSAVAAVTIESMGVTPPCRQETGYSEELHFASGSLVHVDSAILQVLSGDLVLIQPYYKCCLVTLCCNTIINPQRACAARVTVLGWCVCVCVSPLILSLQGPSQLISDTNGASATRA